MSIDNLDFILQSAIPQVYDNSMSYYELLNAVVSKLNSVIDTTNTFSDDMQGYVDTQLTAWQKDGTLGTLISQTLQTDIGDITLLKTTDKSSLTNGVNEVVGVLQSMAINVQNMSGATDDDKIANAISLAQTLGYGVVLLPYKSGGWTVTKAVQLPSNTVFIINNASLKLGAGVMDNIIVNSGARSNPLTANQNIHIIGIGNAVVDGQADINKNFAGLSAGTQYYNDYHRIGINLFNTQNFSIRNIKVREPQGWGISLENGCRTGLVRDIKFDMSNAVINQDGLDIRRGCSDISIENISGTTGDDMIALTTLNYIDSFGNTFQVGANGNWGLDNNISNIRIKNVRGYSAGRNNNVRLLCKDGNKIFNVEIDGVSDQSPSGAGKGTIVVIGSTSYATVSDDVLGDMSDIKVRNIQGYQNVDVINFQSNAQNVDLENIRYFGDQAIALVQFGTSGKNYKNIRMKKLVVQSTIDPTSTSANPSVIYSNNGILEDIFIKDIKANNVRYIMASNSGDTNTIKNLRIKGVYVDGTALQLFRMGAAIFNQYNPSFISDVKVKDLTRVYMAPPAGGDFAGQVFKLGSYCYIENFTQKVLDTTLGGVSLYNLGHGTKMSLGAVPLATGWTLNTGATSLVTVENREGVYYGRIVFDTVNSSAPSQTTASLQIASLPTAINIPRTTRKNIVGYNGAGVFNSLLMMITNDRKISTRTTNGGTVTGVNEIAEDFEFEVTIS